MIKDNILSVNDVIDNYGSGSICKNLAKRLKERRLEMNLSQTALAARSGVSLGTLKRFESHAEASLKHLVMLAVALRCAEGFEGLFTQKNYASFDEAVSTKKAKSRKRGRINA